MKRPCLTCGQPTTGTRCPAHTTTDQRRRPTEHRRAHRDARALLAPLVANGTTCGRCGQPIQPHQAWDADRRPYGWEPAHATCNRSAGARHQA